MISTNSNDTQLAMLGEQSTRLKEKASIKEKVKINVTIWTMNNTITYLLYLNMPHPAITEIEPITTKIKVTKNVHL